MSASKTLCQYIKIEIPGYPGYYADTDGNIWTSFKFKNKLVKKSKALNKDGYETVKLKHHSTHIFVHKLIGLAFLKKEKHHTQICHLNNIKTDNRAVNLIWGTAKINAGHRSLALCINGSKHYNSSLTEKQVIEIIELLKTKKVSDIAKTYGVGKSCINHIKFKRKWRHVTDADNFYKK